MVQSLSTIVEEIRALEPVISELLTISGSPCLSIGVLHHGETIYTNHRRRLDASEYTAPNDDTIYRIASFTKILTVGALSLLVEEGRLHWETRIQEILPEFRLRDDVIGREATIVDVLSNRTGLAQSYGFWTQHNNDFLLPKDEIVRMSCQIQAVKPFRKSFSYTNWNYGLATAVIEKVTQKTLGAFVKEKILDPLDMRRTTIGEPESENNIAIAHVVRNDGTVCKIGFPDFSDATGLAGGGAGKGTVRNLLLMYKSLLSAYNHQRHSDLTSTPGSPFKHLQTLFSPHIELDNSRPSHQSYCLGLYKTVLPGNVGVASPNNAYLGSHNRPFPAELAPGLERPFPQNFGNLSRLARKNQLDAYANLATKLQKGKSTIPPHHPLLAYEGFYYNTLGNFVVQVVAKGQERRLLMIVQGMKSTRYSLLPYDGDTFYWPTGRDQELERILAYMGPGWHKVSFLTDPNGDINRLTWVFDVGAKPEGFMKRSKVRAQNRKETKL